MNKTYRDAAREGLVQKLPDIECFSNQFKHYRITIIVPEFTSLCPKTGNADFGTITIEYEPDSFVVELKSLKIYIHAFRNLAIFYENAVNRILEDIVKSAKPVWAKVKGEFRPRGGISSVVEAEYPGKKSAR